MLARVAIVVVAMTASICGCAVILGISDVPQPSSVADAALDSNLLDTIAPQNDVDPGPCVADAAACNDLPPGWTPWIFSPTAIGCPVDYTGSNVLADPVLQNGACTCAVTSTVPPTCTTLARQTGTQCNLLNGAPDIVVNGACGTVSGTLGNDEQLTQQPTMNGSCTSSVKVDPMKFTNGAPASVCSSTKCQQNICAGIAPPNYKACISHVGDTTSGDTTCPAATIFQTRHFIGDQMNLDCTGVCTSCTASGMCTNGSVSFFSDGNCNSALNGVNANGACQNVGLSGTTFGSEKYTFTVANIAYNQAAPGPAKIGTITPRTLCCAP